jgi:ethanolamine ammonia-lyase small subunit
VNEVVKDPWSELRRFTQARIALGHAGCSLPTRAALEFGLAHAQARDAVHTALDLGRLMTQLSSAGLDGVGVRSAAADRDVYLRRPELGRRLDSESRSRVEAIRTQLRPEVVFVIADGLSAIAAMLHAGLAYWPGHSRGAGARRPGR